MNDGVRVAALIPARAGSKGIANKNLAEVGGRSLLQWAIDLALSIREIDRCIVSTDGEEIASEARALGAEVHPRPERFAGDGSPIVDTIIDVRTWHKLTGGPCEQFVLLQPTSPFRSPDEVRRCLAGLSKGADSAATFARARLHPHQAFRLERDTPRPYLQGPSPWVPRQHLRPPAFQLTGSVYAFWIDRVPDDSPTLLFGDARAIRTPGLFVDIDEQQDLALADMIASQEARPDASLVGYSLGRQRMRERRPTSIVLVGGGGHASDVLQAIEATNTRRPTWRVVGILDDNEADPRRFDGRNVRQIGRVDEIGGVDACFVLCVGWPWARLALAERIRGLAQPSGPVVHPTADIGVGVELGPGSVVLGNAHVSPMVRLGSHSLVSYTASVGHDSILGSFTSVMPGAAVGGEVVVGDGVLVGSGAVLRERVKVGDRARIGAGAVVIDEVEEGVTVAGVPARPLDR